MKNKGKWQHRFSREPLEKRFAETWEKEQVWHDALEYLLSDKVNERSFVSDHDREVAATIIQWLGSTCGQGFVMDVLDLDGFKYESEFREHIRKLSEADEDN